MLNFETLTDEIAAAAFRALGDVATTHRAEALAGFALWSDAGAMGVSPAFNTRANLEAKTRSDPHDAAYYRWSPGEWDLEARGAVHFERLNRLVRLSVAAIPAEQFSLFRAQLFRACVVALQRVSKMPRFAGVLKGAVIVFAVVDFEDPSSEQTWCAELNNAEDAAEFGRWLDSL